MTLRVLGIDPGSAVTGYGVVEPAAGRPGSLVECGIIRTDSRLRIWQRLDALYDGITEIIHRHNPTTVAVESLFYAKNVRTTVVLGHARGVILLAAAQSGLDVVEYSPATVKKSIAGTGRAAKAQVGYMVQQLLRLEKAPTPSDAADGVAVALTCLMAQGVTA